MAYYSYSAGSGTAIEIRHQTTENRRQSLQIFYEDQVEVDRMKKIVNEFKVAASKAVPEREKVRDLLKMKFGPKRARWA